MNVIENAVGRIIPQPGAGTSAGQPLREPDTVLDPSAGSMCHQIKRGMRPWLGTGTLGRARSDGGRASNGMHGVAEAMDVLSPGAVG